MIRCKTARALMMERLYEPPVPEEAAQLEIHLAACPTCAAEWDEVQRAHAILRKFQDPAVPLWLERKVTAASRADSTLGIGIPERRVRVRLWMKLAAAASFLLLLAGVYPYTWQNSVSLRPPIQKEAVPERAAAGIALSPAVDLPAAPPIAMEPLPEAPAPADPPALGVTTRRRAGLASPTDAETLAAGRPVRAFQAQPEAKLAAKPEEAGGNQKAEELFRTGLKLYNTAFTKIGEDQKTLLKSAIVMLEDVEKQHSGETYWIALALILIADSYRALGDTETAARTYQRMIERFPDQETYCRQARESLVKLWLNRSETVQQAENELDVYAAKYPGSLEFARLAMAFCEITRREHPDRAMAWCRRVMEQFPDQHPERQKASRMLALVENPLRDTFYIESWWLMGPLPAETLPEEREGFRLASWLKPLRKPLTSPRYELRRERGMEIDLEKEFKNTVAPASAFARTYLHSATDAEIFLQTGFSDGIRIWCNNAPVWGQITHQDYQKDQYAVMLPLKAGWNEILIKTYHLRPEAAWKFSAIPTGLDGHLLPELKVDPGKGGAISLNE